MTDAAPLPDRRLVLAGAAVAALAAVFPWARASAAPDGSLYVVAELVAKSGQEAALRAALTGFATGAPRERGCIAYHLLEDLAKPGRFLTYETWRDDAALVAHLTSPAMKAAAPSLAAILAQPFALTKLTKLV